MHYLMQNKKKISKWKIVNNTLPIFVGTCFFILTFRILKIYDSGNTALFFYFLVSLAFNYYGIYKHHKNLLNMYYLLSYSILIFYRSPEIFKYGRFFAEEGSVFWSYSLANNYSDILQHLIPTGGYFTLNVNLVMILIKFLPNSFAPFVSTYFSFIVSLLPAFFVYKYNIFELDDLERSYVFGIYVFLQSLNWPEVALNSINSQVYLGVTVFFIVTFGIKSKNIFFRIFEQAVLIIAFLSSFYAVIQFPIIFLRYIYKKSNYLLFTLISSFLTACFQSLVFYYSKRIDILYFEKANNLPNFEYIFNTYLESFLINLVSIKYYKSSFGIILLVLLLLLFLFNVYNSDVFLLVFINSLLQLFLVVFGQADVYFSERYAVVLPTVSFTLVLLLINKQFKKHFIYFLIVIFMLNVASFTFHTSRFFSCNDSCVLWSDQINNDTVEHWPTGGYWITDLKNPKPQPSSFQIDTFNFNYEKYYNFKVSFLLDDIFR